MRRAGIVVVAMLAFAVGITLSGGTLRAGVTALAAEAGNAPPPDGRDTAALSLERKIPLVGVTGRIDHMAFDARHGRLLVAELGNGSLDAIDVQAGRPAARVTGLAEPQGVAYAPQADVILVANGGDGTVRLFRGADLAPRGAIALGEDADDAALDEGSGDAVVGFGMGGLAVIDPARQAVVARVSLPAHPEAFRLDPVADRAFVNIPGARQIAVVDLRVGRQVAHWPLVGSRGNFPMALQQGGGLLAVGFRDPPRLALLRVADGREVAQQPACADADDVFFDARRQRIYLSCGAGVIDVFRDDGGALDRIARIATRFGARTALFVPQLDRLFVAAPAMSGVPAAIFVMRPMP